MYEEYLHVSDNVTQLPPVMNGFYADEMKRTCTQCGTVMAPPIKKG
jgi:3-hydroxyanthranilate 3,4-dioxygenase